jgi:putative RecB family exonuclease
VDRIPQPSSFATAMGRYVHFVLEQIFRLDPADRRADVATSYLDAANEAILTPDVVSDLALDDAGIAKFRDEGLKIAANYFTMEDPAGVTVEGVEERINVDIDGVPLVGILDRLDREDDGSLTIVDYKTGRVPREDYLSGTFANTELYAAMCEAAKGETPARIRLLYVAAGKTIERTVTPVVVRARKEAAVRAWGDINTYYDRGDFPAKPSAGSCRFCAYKDLCRANGVRVPV